MGMSLARGTAAFILLFAIILPAAAYFPSEYDYIWCFGKNTFPARLAADSSSAGLGLPVPAVLETSSYSCPPTSTESYYYCRRALSGIDDARSDWKYSAGQLGKTKSVWAQVEAVNNAESSVISYQVALADILRMQDNILAELRSEGLPGISGLVGLHSGYTPATLEAALADPAAGSRAREAAANAERMRGILAGYYNQYATLARNINTGLVLGSNCSRLANWSMFECSESSWIVISAVCMGSFTTCAAATDCQATVSYNLSKLATTPADYRGFWERESLIDPVPEAIARYASYSSALAKATELEAGYRQKLAEGISCARGNLSAMRQAGIFDLPKEVIFAYLISSEGRGLTATTAEADFLNLTSLAIRAGERIASAEFVTAQRNGTISERVLSLKSSLDSLGEAEFELAEARRIAAGIDGFLAGRAGRTNYSLYSSMDSGERAEALSSFWGYGNFSGLARAACAERGAPFPDGRTGEGLSCSGRETDRELLLALDSMYSASVNGGRQNVLSILNLLDPSERRDALAYESFAQSDWISAERAWGRMAFLDSFYSGIVSKYAGSAPSMSAELSEQLAVANLNRIVTVGGSITNPLPFPVPARDFYSETGLPAGKIDLLWSQGNGTVGSAEILSDGRLRISASIGGSARMDFSASATLPPAATATESSSFETVTSDSYKVSEEYNIACSPGFSGEFLLPIRTSLPSERLVVLSASPHSFGPDGASLHLRCPVASASANLSYLRPITLSYTDISGGYVAKATNTLSFPIEPFVILPAAAESQKATVNGKEYPVLPDSSVQVRDSFAAGETKEYSVRLNSSSASVPDCPFCCGLAARAQSLSKARLAEAQRLLPLIIRNAEILSADEISRIEALLCADRITDALDLSESLVAKKSQAESKQCEALASRAAIDRRLLSVLKTDAESLALLRKRFPSADFSDPPSLSEAESLVNSASRDCNSTGISLAEERIETLRAAADSSFSSAAAWAQGFFSSKYSLSLTLPNDVVAEVEGRIGNGTRLAASGYISSPDGLSGLDSRAVVSRVLAGGENSKRNLQSLADEAQRLLLGRDGPDEAGTYSEIGKAALAEGRLLDGLYAGHYAAILSERAAGKDGSSAAFLAKAAAVAVALALAVAVIFYKEKRKGKKGEENIFGEIR